MWVTEQSTVVSSAARQSRDGWARVLEAGGSQDWQLQGEGLARRQGWGRPFCLSRATAAGSLQTFRRSKEGNTQDAASSVREPFSPRHWKHMAASAPVPLGRGAERWESTQQASRPAAGLLLPTYVIARAYFQIGGRAGDIVGAIRRPLRPAAAATAPSFLV